MTSWPLDFFSTTPAFAPVLPYLQRFSQAPLHADWLTVSERIQTQGGANIQFVDPDSITEYYELEIYQKGRVATRLNWHDTFNATIWQAYPKSKVALNALHFKAMQADPDSKIRGPVRDAATLFDECGLILPYSRPALLELMVAHQWQALFVEEAQAWGQEISAFVFGHATLENLLQPFVGLTGKCWPIQVDADFFALDLIAQRQELDHRIAEQIELHALQTPRQLPPLPYLGIPQWWPEQDADFYANTRYFRHARQKSAPK
ncbi:DUF3025 domain-containing protein [Deefgea piscis]|uniref:DUF3025 domain-containing protein n=1 Tax=Deefgea piscis TaxID=2739061 RepID=UPI001C7E9BB2|nr:DUF3025 domain-containing protein [Deefgea piscis]QZA82107.1 DUF3025 domain-containing protein [Deefgea piscis]